MPRLPRTLPLAAPARLRASAPSSSSSSLPSLLPPTARPSLRAAAARANAAAPSPGATNSCTMASQQPLRAGASSLFRPAPARSLFGPLRPHLGPSLSPAATSSSASASSPILSLLAAAGSHPSTAVGGQPQQKRFAVYGSEYQPSQRVRKRRHGYLARKKSKGGRKILSRRFAKGRKYLSH